MTKTIEQVLVDYNEQPLTQSPHGRTLIALVNAQLKGVKMSIENTGADVLAAVYDHPNEMVVARILAHPLKAVRSRDSYRTFLLAGGGFLALICVILAVSVAVNGGDANSGAVLLMGKIIDGVISVLHSLVDP